jgi:hypothetical protein
MRFVAVRFGPNRPEAWGYPFGRGMWTDYPMALDEPEVCNVQEEHDRIENLPLHWDGDSPVWNESIDYAVWRSELHP